MTVTGDDTTAQALRAELAARLVRKEWIRTPAVRAAFERAPRHLFVPDTVPVTDAYADEIVATKRGPDGKTMSSVSAPWLQAYMLEQAQLRAGARVLEVGSGGYNASLIAELVGPAGHVATVDIDADITARARAYLDHAGYPQVDVVQGDGDLGHPPGAPYDAILVTVEAGDVAPSWTQHLTPDGILVIPLRLRTLTRCLTLRRQEDHLVATAALQCGFVPMQGERRQLARRVPLRGNDIVLLLDDPIEVNTDALTAALDRPRVEVWAPVTITMDEGTSFESLHLWLASQPRPFGALTVDRKATEGLMDPQDRFTCPTLLADDSFAYLAMRKVAENDWQFGAHGFGPAAAKLAADLIELVTTWDRDFRHGAAPSITVHPAGTALPAAEHLQLAVPRRHTTTAITWPAPGSQR
ncbi:methyltransferase, FxLD system [Actinoplanes sp. HUAS TT8]|uniref:methyltransferase, FxLD system n=1 Tax=Actinoplanes sp. HUAS TT8 TaxID=3447453 RepID=UPI003F51CD25